MAKFFKIAAIVVASLILLVLVAVGVALKFVVTPERLTPIVRQVADKFITSKYNLEEVDLTFFSTFPEFGLRVKGLCIINHVEGCQNDTLIAVPELVAKVDVKEFLDNNNLRVYELALKNGTANIFMAADGRDNFSIFDLGSDTVEVETEDSSTFALPFNNMYIDRLVLTTTALTFVDQKDSIEAAVASADVRLKINNLEDVSLTGDLRRVKAKLGTEVYADGLDVSVKTPVSVNLDSMRFVFQPSALQINEFALSLEGEVEVLDDIKMDVRAGFKDWQIASFLRLVPPTLMKELKDISVDGLLSLDAHVSGIYNDSTLPLIDATVSLREGDVLYADVPYRLQNLQAGVQAHINLNDKKAASYVICDNISGITKNTTFALKGRVDDVLADMLINMRAKVDVNIPDFKAYIPENINLLGKVKGDVSARIRMSDLSNMRLERGLINGNLRMSRLDVKMDSLLAQVPASELSFRIPNRQSSNKSTQWLGGTLSFDKVDVEMINTLTTKLGESRLDFAVSNVLSDDEVLYADVALVSGERLQVKMDSMEALVVAPDLSASVEYNLKDTTVLPTLSVGLKFDELKGNYTDMVGQLAKSDISFNLKPNKKDKTSPQFNAEIACAAINAAMGEEMKLRTKAIKVGAKARYNKNGENVLTQWRPKLQIDLKDAFVDMASFGEQIKIPSIHFAYSNKECNISNSHIIIGKSDFSLVGEVRNIGKWVQKKDTLVGVLNFTSNNTDVNELMRLCSADSGTEEASPTQATIPQTDAEKPKEDSVQEPFLVPKDVDLTLNTEIKHAKIFKEDVSNLLGRVYIKDGKLVLEEMGFVCKAAKLQLTALYRTPRRNHIYVGFDYHMLDVDIMELISMIPQLDTMLPMLSSFRGQAEFHLAGETYVNERYEVKTSTLRGACSLFGKDLVVLDGETFSQISKLLRFKKKTENKIDSISAELTLYKKEIDVYPFCVSMDNYMVAVGGRHNLDMTFDYHVNLLKPLYLGVNVSGNMDDLKIRLGKCVYAKDFRPIFHKKTESQAMEMRQIIRNSMQRNVKIQYDGVRNKSE